MLNLLIESLRDISEDYVIYVNDAGKRCTHLERIFTYELYRKWADLLDDPKLNPNRLILHGEIVKGFENQTRRYPDFVLHGSQGDVTNQEIVCEIKRKVNFNKKKFVCDLNKIVEFFNSKKTFSHPFKCGVFILVGGDMSVLKLYAKNLPEEIARYSDKIFLISHRGKETFNPDEDIKALKELL